MCSLLLSWSQWKPLAGSLGTFHTSVSTISLCWFFLLTCFRSTDIFRPQVRTSYPLTVKALRPFSNHPFPYNQGWVSGGCAEIKMHGK